jgi:cell division protein FtsB
MKRWIIAVPLIAGAAYYALFGGEYSLFEARKLESERIREEAMLQATRRDVSVLRARSDSLEHDSATLERIARERYGLIKEGERLYRFVDSANAKALPRDTVVGTTTN